MWISIYPLSVYRGAVYRNMKLTFFRDLIESPPIDKQIAHYVEWKAVRFPDTAASHKRVLVAFFKSYRIRCVQDITPESLQEHLSGFNANYQKNQFLHVMRQFCRYWYQMGLLTGEFRSIFTEAAINSIIENASPTMHTEQVVRVHKLRDQGLSLRQIKMQMETEDQKVYHLKQIQRWAKYEITTLSPGKKITV